MLDFQGCQSGMGSTINLKNLKRGKIPYLPNISILSIKSNELLFVNIGLQGESLADYFKSITNSFRPGFFTS